MNPKIRYQLFLAIAISGFVAYSPCPVKSQEKKGQETSKDGTGFDHHSYAIAQLRVAKALLQQAKEKNESTSDLIADAEIQRLQMNVNLSEDLLARAELGEKQLSDAFFMQFSKDQLAAAKLKLLKALEIRKIVPSRASDADIEVLRAKLNLAEIELARGKHAINQSATDEIRWKLNLLLKEILRLSRESVQTVPR